MSDPGSIGPVNGTGYKILGFVVWRGARWYVRRAARRYVPSRPAAVGAGALAVAVIAAVVLAGKRDSS